jgi:hypothetical protein
LDVAKTRVGPIRLDPQRDENIGLERGASRLANRRSKRAPIRNHVIRGQHHHDRIGVFG